MHFDLVLTSDIHGDLFDPSLVEAGDVMLIAGDVCPDFDGEDPIKAQREWLKTEFIPWVKQFDLSMVLVGWGNHDWYGEHCYRRYHNAGLDPELEAMMPSHVKFLTDRSYMLPQGIKVYVTPWQPNFCGWAFNAIDDIDNLGNKFAEIPEDTEVLVVHGPPFGHGDRVYQQAGADRVGSKELLLRLNRLPRLRLVVCGHIHESYGAYKHVTPTGRTIDIANVSRCNRVRMPVNPLVYWKL